MFNRKRIARLEMAIGHLEQGLYEAGVYDAETQWRDVPTYTRCINLPQLNERVKGIIHHLALEEVRQPAQTVLRKKETK